MWLKKIANEKRGAPHIILASLPSLCQKRFSQLLENLPML